MTTIVSRLFADAKTAEQAVTALKLQNHPEDIIAMVPAGSGAESAMEAAGVSAEYAAAYAKAMKSGSAVVVVRAPVTPFGAARNAIDTMDQFDSVDAGIENENAYVPQESSADLLMDLKVDRTHRYWATWGNERPRGKVSDAFGWKTVYSGTKYFGTFMGKPTDSGRKYWGTFVGSPLDSGRKYWGTFAGSPILSGTHHFADFLMPLLSKRSDRR